MDQTRHGKCNFFYPSRFFHYILSPKIVNYSTNVLKLNIVYCKKEADIKILRSISTHLLILNTRGNYNTTIPFYPFYPIQKPLTLLIGCTKKGHTIATSSAKIPHTGDKASLDRCG